MEREFAYSESQGEPTCKTSSTDSSSEGPELHLGGLQESTELSQGWTVSGRWLQGALERADELTLRSQEDASNLFPEH